MQSRRHATVAAVIVATQFLSLAVATDILGADVSTYARRPGSIAAVGTQPDIGTTRSAVGEGWAALDLSLIRLPEPAAVVDPATGRRAGPGRAADDVDSARKHKSERTGADNPAPITAVPVGSAQPATAANPAPATSPPTVDEAGAPVAANRRPTPSRIETPTTSSTVTTTRTTSPPEPAPAGTTRTSVPAGVTAPATTSVTVSRSTPRPTRSTSTTTPAPPTTTTTIPTTTATTSATTTTTTTTSTTTTTTTTTTTAKAPNTTAPPTTVPPTSKPTVPPKTTPAPKGSNKGLEAIRNDDPRFSRYATVRSDRLKLADLTVPAVVPDNGTVGDGQFRAACQYSHFGYDDPIVYPNQPGRSHLHMFFGNTGTNAGSTTNSIVNAGGGSCNGFELNRSAYWTPALLDGRGNAVVPDMIILYYKSKDPGTVQRMPQGLKMVSGNTSAESFTVSDFLYWSCGDSGFTYNKSNRIPNCNGDTINATIAFPQCWDGRNMDSADHRSHMALVSPHEPCPASHPVTLPQISILMYFPGDAWTKDWHLSSDRSGGFNTGSGATLHGDWWGGWNDETMDLWTNGCMKAARNCSFGQTGTNRQLAKLNNFQNYPGQNLLPLP